MRRAADQWLTVRTHDGTRSIRWDELEEFEFDGEPFKLKDRQRGIRKPRELTAALPITTTYTPPGRPRRYVLRQTRQRLHQPVFRATVLHAYGTRCAVCAPRHAELLDAAHIVADIYEGGIDGPMLEHGLKARHGQPLMVQPQKRADRPDPELLDRRYAEFRTAG